MRRADEKVSMGKVHQEVIIARKRLIKRR